MLVELFDRIESFFTRIKIYTDVPHTPELTEALAEIMAEVLSILAIATRGMKKKWWSKSIFCHKLLLGQLQTEIFLKQLARTNDIEDALQKFGKLEHGELLIVIAQVARSM